MSHHGIEPSLRRPRIQRTLALDPRAGKADWRQFAAALAVVIAGVVAAFVGPSAAWPAAGIGLFVATLGYAAADAMAPWTSGV